MKVVNRFSIIDKIRLLIYKENPALFEKINFDDEEVFLEPLLFAFFNQTNKFNKNYLIYILQGYFTKNDEILFFENVKLDYIPNKGYFKNKIKVSEIFIIPNTKIELLKSRINLLDPLFKTTTGENVNSDKIIINQELIDKYIFNIENALKYIKQSSPKHYRLLELCCKKILIFYTELEDVNSFASINAHGIVFLNVYQEDYDEVFFVDDIAHQTGHIILTTIFFDRKKIFKIDENENIRVILENNDYRSFYTLFHALYTYHTTFLCLDNCLDSNLFSKEQKFEAVARIGFYLRKCAVDINYFKKIIDYYVCLEEVLFTEGILIYNEIAKTYSKTSKKWGSIISKFNYSEQPYNFTYSIFIKHNKHIKK